MSTPVWERSDMKLHTRPKEQFSVSFLQARRVAFLSSNSTKWRVTTALLFQTAVKLTTLVNITLLLLHKASSSRLYWFTFVWVSFVTLKCRWLGFPFPTPRLLIVCRSRALHSPEQVFSSSSVTGFFKPWTHHQSFQTEKSVNTCVKLKNSFYIMATMVKLESVVMSSGPTTYLYAL